MTFAKYWFTYSLGKWRLAWGFCPECNGGSPDLYTCPTCRGSRAFPPTLENKKLWEQRWLNVLNASRALYKTNKQLQGKSKNSEGE